MSTTNTQVRSDAMGESRCEWHLDNWAQWMGGRQHGLGYPTRASGRMGKSNSTSFEAMVHNADVRCAFAVDALVDDLSPVLRRAIYAVKLAEAWPHLLDLDQVYVLARDTIARGLYARGIM